MKRILLALCVGFCVAPAAAGARPFVRLAAPPTLARPIAYQWLRCNTHGHQCHEIPRATHRIYVMRQRDAGHTIKVRMEFCCKELTSSKSAVVVSDAS